MPTPEYKFQPPFHYYGYDAISLREAFNDLIQAFNEWQIEGFLSNDSTKLIARIEYARQILAPNIYEKGSNAEALKACDDMKAFVEAHSS